MLVNRISPGVVELMTDAMDERLQVIEKENSSQRRSAFIPKALVSGHLASQSEWHRREVRRGSSQGGDAGERGLLQTLPRPDAFGCDHDDGSRIYDRKKVRKRRSVATT